MQINYGYENGDCYNNSILNLIGNIDEIQLVQRALTDEEISRANDLLFLVFTGL